MALKIKISQAAEKTLAKMGRNESARIIDFVHGRLSALDDPTVIGKPLKGHLDHYWCYRVGDWRLFCLLTADGEVQVLVVTIGHRREVYK